MGLFDFIRKKNVPSETQKVKVEPTIVSEETSVVEPEVNEPVIIDADTQPSAVLGESAVEQNDTSTEVGLSAEEYGKLAMERLINETKVPMMNITTVDDQPSIFDSKIGGMPYLPTDIEVPLDSAGNPMRLLAQINCKDLTGLDEYPQEGMLQFYLTTNPMWEESAVKYYANVDDSVTSDAISEKLAGIYTGDNGCFPVEREYGMEFSVGEESMSADDDRLMALFCQYYTELANDWISMPEDAGDEVYEMFERYCDNSYAGGHKVGGYQSAAQPPYYFHYKKDAQPIDVNADDSKVLLFQMDSESNKGIMWGDLGVARFFIKRSDLKAGNWEEAYLVWDCS